MKDYCMQKINRESIPIDDYRLIDFPGLRDEYMKYGLSHAWDQLTIDKQFEIVSILLTESLEQATKIMNCIHSLEGK